MPLTLHQNEKDIQTSILNHLKKTRGLFVWRNNSGVTVMQGRFIRFGVVGAPDIIGILPGGRFLGIEVKKPGGRVRPEQENFLQDIRKNNGLAILAYSLEDVKRGLSGITNR